MNITNLWISFTRESKFILKKTLIKCLLINNLNLYERTISLETIVKKYKDCYDKSGDEKHNLNNAITIETCDFAKKLMFILNKSVLTVEDVQNCQESKDYLYRVFFQPDYEPLVEEIENQNKNPNKIFAKNRLSICFFCFATLRNLKNINTKI